MSPLLFGFTVYLIVVLIIGVSASRRTKNLADFALGGKKLNPWVLALSERASSESAWLIIGLPGLALVSGLSGLWTVTGIFLGSLASWYLIAPRLQQASTHNLTLPEFLASRFNDDSWILIVSSLIITFFFTFYVSAQFAGAGKVLNVTFGIPKMTGMIIGASIIIFYTVIGGFIAVSMTDFFQALIMFGTLVVLPIIGYIELTGLNPNTDLIAFNTLFERKTGLGALTVVAGGLSWGFGYMGNPHIIARYMAAKDEQTIKKGQKIVIAYSIPAFLGALFIGLVGKALLDAGGIHISGELVTAVTDKEKIMPLMANALLNPWIAGFFISGAIAAMMSTADSQLLVTTTVLTQDFIGKFTNIDRHTAILKIGQALTILVGIAAFTLAWQSNELVFEMVSYAWGGLGASFGPVLIAVLWWDKTSKAGVLSGLIAGTYFTIVPILPQLVTPRISAFFLAGAAIIVASIIFKHQN